MQWVTSLHYHPHPHLFFSASTHDISPLQRNGIFQFQMSAKEKGQRLKFSFNGRPGKKKNEVASRLGTPLLAFFSSPAPFITLWQPGHQANGSCWLSPAGCLLLPGPVWWQPSCPQAGFLLAQGQLLVGFVSGLPLGSADWCLTRKDKISRSGHQVTVQMRWSWDRLLILHLKWLFLDS